MAVQVKVPTILRPQTGGESVVTGEGGTVREVLTDLDGRFPGLLARVAEEDGAIHRFVNVYVNDEDVRYLGALETEVRDGDVVSILPAVAGGADRKDRRTDTVRFPFKLTPRAERILTKHAPEECRRFQANFVGVEHLFLAILREGASVPAQVAQRLGVAGALEKELERVLTSDEYRGG
jgi:sulfur-carrier protein